MSYFKKPKTPVPYEISNAREWDPRKKVKDSLSSEDEDDHDIENRSPDGLAVSHPQRQAKVPAPLLDLEEDDDGLQKPVIRRFTELQKNDDSVKTFTQTEKSVQGPAHTKKSVLESAHIEKKRAIEVKPITKTIAKPDILLDQQGRRIDPAIQCDSNAVNHIRKLNLCVKHFLTTGCRNKEACYYNHQYEPTKNELQALRFLARLSMCKFGSRCNYATCVYGHDSLDDTITSQIARKAPSMPLQPITNRQTPKENEVFRPDRSSLEQPMFRFRKDNLARAAFRRREGCTGKFLFHKKIIEIEPDPNCLETLLQEIGLRIGSFIRPPQTAQDQELLIWGSLIQVSQTQVELKNWIHRSESPGNLALNREKFAHEYSTRGVKYQDVRREMARKARIHRFQQIPDPEQLFEYQGAYLWPVEDVIPQDIFGSNLEAFDQIRFILKSHIIFDNNLHIFRIYTDDSESVPKALKLIEGTLKEFHACSGRPSYFLFMDVPTHKNTGNSVRMQTWLSSPESVKRYLPLLTSGTSDPKSYVEWNSQRTKITLSNALEIQEALELAISRMRFLRGQVSMKICFGTFAFTHFKWPKKKAASISLEDFRQVVSEESTKGQMSKNLLFDKDPSEIFNAICSLTDSLKPLDSAVETLHEVAPIYEARFEINRFERPAMQLEVVMENIAGEPELFDKTHSVWTRLDHKDSNVLDISMLRLEGPSWKLRISTEQLLDRSNIDKQMAEFADSVELKSSKPGAVLDGRRLFDWGNRNEAPGFLKPSVFEQKIVLRYRLTYDQAFIVEIARYDSYDLSSGAQRPSTTYWGASMVNSDWDLILSENASLGLGECANWDTRLQTFFPSPKLVDNDPNPIEVEPGLRSFLHHVRKTAESLDKIKGRFQS